MSSLMARLCHLVSIRLRYLPARRADPVTHRWVSYHFAPLSIVLRPVVAPVVPCCIEVVECVAALHVRMQVLRLMDKMVGDIEYNKPAQTKSFRWRETASSPMHQVTYDDKETYSLKYKWALESGFRGVGFWMVRVR